jgi:hypothetical protein
MALLAPGYGRQRAGDQQSLQLENDINLLQVTDEN